MAKYKAVIFDLDGTILNTLDDLADALNHALSKNGFERRTLDEVRWFAGNGIAKLIERALPPDTDGCVRERVHGDFTAYYTVHCGDKTKPYDGIWELLQRLMQQKCMTAVVSNKADYAVQILCKQYFDALLDEAVGERAGIRRKPYPDMLDNVLEKLNCRREEAVYVGDSEVDIQTAKNAGVDCIIVGWGFRDKKFLFEQGAEMFADDVPRLGEMLI